jgi:hypothetical protein
MCQLEMCFPLSFFDMMEHYMIHIEDQISILSPVYLHHMYPYERYMSIMKGYVHNRAHPEGPLIEGYTTDEEFFNDYMKDGKPIGVLVSQYEGRLTGKGTIGKKTFNDQSYERVREAHFSVTLGFKATLNTHSMCSHESSLRTYHSENRYRITNVTIYNINYRIMSYKRLSRTISETLQLKDTITP